MTQLFRFGATALLTLTLSHSLPAQTPANPVRKSGVVRSSGLKTTPKPTKPTNPRDRELLIRLQQFALPLAEETPVEVNWQNSTALASLAESIHTVPHTGFLQVRLKPGLDVAQAMAQLATQPEFAGVLHVHTLTHCSTPNDTLFSQQYGPMKMRMTSAWDLWRPLNTATEPIIVASIDTGVMSTHQDLTAKMFRNSSGNVIGYNFVTNTPGEAPDDYGHGTHTSGIMVATTNNGVGIAGIAGWTGVAGQTDTTSVKLMPIKVLDASGNGSDADVANGITWATDHGARVINMSLGDSDPALADPNQTPLVGAVAYAISRGVVVVCAAGNQQSTNYFYPAAYPNTISVAATQNDSTDSIPYWSNRGGWVNVSAPGADIISTFYNGSYINESGTSMASPHVAGLAALLLAQNPSLTGTQVRQIILNTVRPYGAGSLISSTGGPVDGLNAMNATLATVPSPASLASLTVNVTPQYATNAAQLVSVTFLPTNGSTSFVRAANMTQTTSSAMTGSATGAMTFSRLIPGSYQVRIKTPQTLAKLVPVTLTAGQTGIISASLLTGDVNDDNVVNVDDLSALLFVFHATAGDGKYLPNADLDQNGTVDVDDLSILLFNFNVNGQ